MKAQLYTAAILFACSQCEVEVKSERADRDAKARDEIAAWPKWLGWFRPKFTISTAYSGQLAHVRRLTAIAKHHKPGSMLLVEDEYLDAIALYLAPSEAYADGDITGRI